MFDKTKIIPIASDHGGFEMKSFLIDELLKHGYQIKDMGTYSDASVDYPDMIHPLASAVDKGEYERAIILCGSGNGAQMTANKYQNVRAALCWNVEQAELTRLHNNANIISIPGRFVEKTEAWKMVDLFLNTDFEAGRHVNRVNKIACK